MGEDHDEWDEEEIEEYILWCEELFHECLDSGATEEECWMLFDECLSGEEWEEDEEDPTCWDEFEPVQKKQEMLNHAGQHT